MTLREIGTLLRSRSVSCTELIQRTLEDLIKDKCNSLIRITAETALAEAAERDAEFARGLDRGPFHGVPIAYKDLFYTRGVTTTGGSLLYKDFVPETDADVVTKLREAGAISLGKTNLHELAFGITSNNPHFGAVLNPRDLSRIPGGSSGGSASLVGAGLLPMCLGTDTGGSIRVPASYCGITGLKPTYGVVSRRGVLPLAFSLDHVGPLASCVEDCALTMDVIAESGAPFLSEPLPTLAGIRIGVPTNRIFEDLDEQVSVAVTRAAELMGRLDATMVPVAIPDLDEANMAARIVQLVEFASIYAHQTDPSQFGQDVWALLEQGRMIPGHTYVNAQRVRTLFRRDFDRLWEKIDVLVCPTTPITAPHLNQTTVSINGKEEDTRMASTRFVRAFNFLGEPALSMPCGRDSNGMPIGLQMIAAPFQDGLLLQIAGAVEKALPHEIGG